MCEREYEILKEKISEIIPIIERSIASAADQKYVVIEDVEVTYSSASRMLDEFKNILNSKEATLEEYGFIPMRLIVSNNGIREIQVAINKIRQQKRKEELSL